MSDLVVTAEIAERLGISHSETIHLWRRRYADFPKPVFERQRVILFSWAEVEAWARERKPDRLPEV